MSYREIALGVLCNWAPGDLRAMQRLEEGFAAFGSSSSERARAIEVTFGVIRRRETLSALLRLHVKRPLHQVESGARALLQIGAYELIFMRSSRPYAAVDEAVELARRAGKPQWTKFINGVLRSLSRSITTEVTSTMQANAVPLSDGKYRLVDGSPFADPATDPLRYFAQAFSYPRWLVQRWNERFGFDELVRLGFWFNGAVPVCLRVNPLRTTREALLAALTSAEFAARAAEHPLAIRLDKSAPVTGMPGYHEGWFVVQDESGMWAATLLDPRPGERVLDLCAAPGGKSTHLAALMHDEGTIIAADAGASRLPMIDETCRRMGITCIEPHLIGYDGTGLPEGPFDAVLVDVPCSNTGVMGKRPEVRWRLSMKDIDELVVIQRRLLKSALERVAPGGRAVYSTCSIEPEENRAVVDAVLADLPQWEIAREEFHVPGRPSDGAYQALLRLNS